MAEGAGAQDDGRGNVTRLPLMIMAAVGVMAALVTFAIATNRGPLDYAEGSPEAVLQEFVSSSFDNDESAMLELLTDDARERCLAAFDDGLYDRSWSTGNMRADLDEFVLDGEAARATVRFVEGSDDPFGGSSWDYERSFTLVRVDGAWRVDRAGWPYPFDDCTREGN